MQFCFGRNEVNVIATIRVLKAQKYYRPKLDLASLLIRKENKKIKTRKTKKETTSNVLLLTYI